MGRWWVARGGSCGPTKKLILLRTQSLVLCSKQEITEIFPHALGFETLTPFFSQQTGFAKIRSSLLITQSNKVGFILKAYCVAQNGTLYALSTVRNFACFLPSGSRHFILSKSSPNPNQVWWERWVVFTCDLVGRSLFRRPLSGTVFLPTSDTAAPSYSSKLPLRPSSSLIPSPSFLYSLEDLRFFLPHRLLMFVCCWFVGESESDW